MSTNNSSTDREEHKRTKEQSNLTIPESEPDSSDDGASPADHKPVVNKTLQRIKYVYSSVLCIFSGVIIVGNIFAEHTRLAHDVHPGVALVVLAVAIAWLTMVEGGQGAIVGLAPVQRSLYADSHKHSLKCIEIVHKGDNLDRYLLGRQFMVILIVFTVEFAGASHGDHIELWGLPGWMVNMFLVSGVAMILFTCMVGQLNSEINGAHCMLDYLNTWFAVFTVWVALAIEFSGILHICYLIQQLVANLAGKPIESNEPPRSLVKHIFFYGRCLVSIAILIFSFMVTLKALFSGNTTMWEGVPPGASVVIFFVLMAVIGLLEGSQIAYFAVSKLPQEERGDGYFARKTCDIIFRGNNHNLGAFLIGRQLCVVSCMFFIARITAVKLDDGEDNIYGVSNGAQELFNTGLLGAFCVAVVGSISWRLIASAFPMAFLENPFTYILLRLCLFLEMTGVLHGAYVIAFIHKKIAGFKRDEVYIGTAEERASSKMADDSKVLHTGPGHIIPDTEYTDTELDLEENNCISRAAKTAEVGKP